MALPRVRGLASLRWHAARALVARVDLSAAAPPPPGATDPRHVGLKTHVANAPRHPDVPLHDAVFANNFLRLDEIQHYGFDFDFTIAEYKDELGALIYDLALRHLIEKMNYPDNMMADLSYDHSFPIRGLVYDPKTGWLIKLDHHYRFGPHDVYFGRQTLTPAEISKRYPTWHIPLPDRAELTEMSDIFSMPEAALLADITQYFVENNVQFEPTFIGADIRDAVRYVHKSFTVHNAVRENLPRFLTPSPQIVDLLSKLRDNGKTVFLLTNSPYSYINDCMAYITQSKSWRELFNLVVTMASKPKWYTRPRQFRKVNAAGAISWPTVDNFEEGSTYAHGSLTALQQIVNWDNRRVLYFGDQIYNDLVEPSRFSGWRTGAIIRELEKEITFQSNSEYRSTLKAAFKLQNSIIEASRLGKPTEDLSEQLVYLQDYLRRKLSCRFGSVFRTHFTPTLFAYNLQRNADIYTSRIDCLIPYLPSECFFPSRQYLAHEVPIV